MFRCSFVAEQVQSFRCPLVAEQVPSFRCPLVAEQVPSFRCSFVVKQVPLFRGSLGFRTFPFTLMFSLFRLCLTTCGSPPFLCREILPMLVNREQIDEHEVGWSF